jgi:hypothetical protein
MARVNMRHLAYKKVRFAFLHKLKVKASYNKFNALFFLARSVFSSLDIIERVRVRQLIAVEMAERLRNAEAALYRYQIEGKRGFATQFQDQIRSFGESVRSYQTLEEEKSFSPKLLQTQQDVKTVGDEWKMKWKG